jgi:spermidine synthase
VRRQLNFEIFAATLAAALIEIGYTRILAFKLYSFFASLVVGLGLLGLGAGGMVVAASRGLAGPARSQLVAWTCLGGGAAAGGGCAVIASLRLDASAFAGEPLQSVKLGAASLLLAAPLVAAGVMVGFVLATRAQAMGSLIAGGFVGTGLGCALSVPLIEVLDPPRVVMLAGALLTAAALPFAVRARVLLAACVVSIGTLAASATFWNWYPDPVVDRAKGFEALRQHRLAGSTRWSPVFRLDVVESPQTPRDPWLLHRDGMVGSEMAHLPSSVDRLERTARRLPFNALRQPAARVLVLGAFGADEIAAALRFSTAHVTGVEPDAETLRLLGDSSGGTPIRLKVDPRVQLVHGDARWFLDQTRETFDLIWVVAPDLYAAMKSATSKAFVAIESNLYTVEMIEGAFRRLAYGGVLCAQFGEPDYDRKPNRTFRFLATAKQFFHEAPIPEFDARVMVASSAPGFGPSVKTTVVLSREPFPPLQIERFTLHAENQVPRGVTRFAPGRTPDNSLIPWLIGYRRDLVGDPYRDLPYYVGPVRDDSPFFWHVTRFSDALGTPEPSTGGPFDRSDGLGELVLLQELALSAVLGLALALLPLMKNRRAWGSIANKAGFAAYFATIGIGFVFVEAAVRHRFGTMLGHPARTFTVTLLVLLLSAATGSVLSARYTKSPERALGLLVAALFVLLSLWHLAAPRAAQASVGASLAIRSLVILLLVAPVGACLGAFVPVGLSAAGGSSLERRQFIAWLWAVCALAAVVGSILAKVVAMATGFKFLLVAAPAIYCAGALALVQAQESAVER